MRIFLHIGWRRTATTSIQRFLRENREALLARSGVLYPQAGLHYNGHHVPAWLLWSPPPKRLPGKIDPGANAEGVLAAMTEEARGRGAETLIISSEELSAIERYDPARLKRALEPHATTVVAYVRRQDAYLESLYSYRVQSARSRLRKSMAAFVEDHLEGGALDYHVHFRRWAELFGAQNVKVRVYERGRFPGGDARRDFCDFVGIDAAGLAFAADESNVSLDADSIRFLSRLNAIPLSEAQHRKVVEALGQLAGRAAGVPAGSLLAAPERARILERCAGSNERFAREFLGGAAFEGGVGEPHAPAAAAADSREAFMETLAALVPALLGTPDTRLRRQRD